jgi:hypothetical protein
MTSVRDVLDLSRRELAELLAGGHPIDAEALDDTEYRGVSLGLGRLIEALTWKTFAKTFHRDPETGRLRGWNVRLAQTGLDGPIEPRRTFGHYEVVGATERSVPTKWRAGLLLDYAAPGNGRFDPIRLVRDPLVALEAGSPDLLLGATYLQVGRLTIPTPSFFVLERLGPLGKRTPTAREVVTR